MCSELSCDVDEVGGATNHHIDNGKPASGWIVSFNQFIHTYVFLLHFWHSNIITTFLARLLQCIAQNFI